METVKKYWFWGVFISILSIFAMSHNANAVQPVIDLNNYSLVRSFSSFNNTCSFSGGLNATTSGQTYCQITVNGSTRLLTITSENAYEVKKGDLITFYLFIYSRTNGFETRPVLNIMSATGGGWDVLDYRIVTREDYDKELQSHTGYINQQGVNYDLNVDFDEYSGFYRIYEITMRANKADNLYYGLTAGASGLWTMDSVDIGQIIRFSIRNVSQYRFAGDEANKEVQEKTQEAVDDSQAAGGSSSSDAQTGTTGLLNAITGAVSVISSAQPTNCKINGNMGNLDIGQLDLCANPAPAFVQTIGSLILILMCVPLAISLFNRFIAIFRSFQS